MVEGFWIQSEKLYLKDMSPHLVLFSKKSFHGGLDFIGGFYRRICERGVQDK
jgi:hypothetical protein